MEENSFEYHLPRENDAIHTIRTLANSVIIIGANGSGKTRLGRWIEQKSPERFRFISAQRGLEFRDSFQMQNIDSLQEKLIKGEALNTSGGRDFKPTKERRDVDTVFTSVFSLLFKELNEEDRRRKDHPNTERSDKISDKFTKIWNEVFPQRTISFEDLKLLASIPAGGSSYNAREMSDGERVSLYLIAHALLIPDGTGIIIDEPEIHLHCSIVNKLWMAIEKEKKNCLFIYITHDTQFAANHVKSDKIWVKDFDGVKWDYERIDSSDMPEELLLDILGNRKPVIFVEGTNTSYDASLYSAIYKDYYIVPCGGCSEVISRTKAFRKIQSEKPQLHHVNVYGIIDRDYRNEHEIAALANHGIYTLSVAEVENLFLVEELLTIVNRNQRFADCSNVDKVKKYIIEERFFKQLSSQICEATVSEIKYRLSSIEISLNQNEAQSSMQTELSRISFEAIHREIATQFNNIKESHDYKLVLKWFNYKNISDSIGSYFGLCNREYCNLILRHAYTDSILEIRNALKDYLPQEIPLALDV